MKVIRINHLGIVPKDTAVAESFFSKVLGLKNEGGEEVAEQKVAVEFLRVENSRLELLSATDPSSPIAKFLETKGAGIQHVALEVDSIDEWLAYLKEQQVKLIDQEPRRGAHGTRIAFIHPHATGGVLVELCEEAKV